jgi:hypothetical protein
MARLTAADPDLFAVDFHSHTSYSWDARKSFSPLKNLDWHERGGFHGTFITDHNRTAGAEEAERMTESVSRRGEIFAFRGEEVSLHQSHWAVLGNRELIQNSRYDGDLDGIRHFLKETEKKGWIAIASLPEFWLYHSERLSELSAWGAGGFEIANSAPLALDFPAGLRSKVLALCRQRNLPVLAVSDTHGWGRTVYCWNLVNLPGWRQWPRGKVEPALLETLKKTGFKAVRPVVRIKAEPRSGWSSALDPFFQLWEAARSMPKAQAAASFLWITFFCAAGAFCKKREILD